MIKKKIHIIGSGFSGLSLACLLSETGLFDITVFDKDSKTGGLIQSEITPLGLFEKAANSILLNNDMLKFFNDFKIDFIKPQKTAKARYFYRNKLTRWPLNFFESVHFLIKIIFHLITFKKFLNPQPIQTLGDWATDKLTPAFNQYIFSPGLQGIYSVVNQQLDAELFLNDLLVHKKESKKYHGTVSGLTGTANILIQMTEFLKKNHVHFKLNTAYNFEFSDPQTIKIIATSITDATALIENSKLELTALCQLLKSVNTNDVLTITAFTKKNKNTPQGFGCLIPDDQNINCLGVLFNSDIFENRCLPELTSETYIFGGNKAYSISQKSEIDQISEIQQIRSLLFKNNDLIQNIYHKFWEKGLPIYDQQVKNFQAQYKKLIPNKNIYLHGNYVAGIGLSKIMSHSYYLKNQIIKDHS